MKDIVPMREIDHEIWQRELDEFVPKVIHDAHVHLSCTAFDVGTTPAERAKSQNAAARGFGNNTMELWQTWNAALFPGREVHGSCMGSPYLKVDIDGLNRFVVEQVVKDPGSAALMLVRPGMDPEAVDGFIQENGIVGMKPYRFYSVTGELNECRITDYLPEDLIEVAEGRGLMIILHLSKARAAADPQNLADLARLSRKYPRVKWQLAHCARCFIPSFMEESIDQLAALENVWFDTSAVCESDVFDVLFSRGPRERILFGTDNLPAGVDRGKYVAFGYAWQVLTEDNQSFNLSHCNPDPTWVVYEELRGLRRIAQRLGFMQGEIEDLFYNNASRLLASIGS